jgi:hypothetical protein
LRRARDSCLKGIVMSATTSAAQPAKAEKPYCPIELMKPYLTPYYLTVAAVLGAMTAGLVALVVVLILIATNFNVLSLIE